MAGELSVTVDIRDLTAALSRLDGATRGAALASAVMAGGLVVEGEGKQNIIRYDFIDTGATLNSTAAREGDLSGDEAEAEIGPATEYAIFGELGIGQSAKPFMREALESNKSAIVQAVADELRAAIERASR